MYGRTVYGWTGSGQIVTKNNNYKNNSDKKNSFKINKHKNVYVCGKIKNFAQKQKNFRPHLDKAKDLWYDYKIRSLP